MILSYAIVASPMLVAVILLFLLTCLVALDGERIDRDD